MTTGPTPEQAAAQVALIRRDRPDARVIGIHAPGPWLSGTTLTVQGETFPVAYCTSALQVSEALVSHPADAPPPWRCWRGVLSRSTCAATRGCRRNCVLPCTSV